ncbi:MAG: hydrolase [Candidatus Woesearchaeota archaeon]|nr:MAG: hydrolase [Candidatus Woesearchaeota archaeon]
MSECIFCKIIKKEIPSYIIYEDKKFMAFLDIHPWTEGHTLLIPKKHYDYLFDIEENEYNELMNRARLLALSMKEIMGVKRIGVAVEGFEVSHVHIHLIPMNSPSDFNPKNAKSFSKEELQRTHQKLADLKI